MTERRRTLIVDAFTDEPMGGNPAGVVPDAEGLAVDQMQRIARELNASETAFVFPSGGAGRTIRYFTPETEVDLCGHATIATCHHLAEVGELDAGTHAVETNAGTIDVEVEDGGVVWMTQGAADVREVDVDEEQVVEALGIDEAALLDDLPILWASTGLPYLVVPLEFSEHLGRLDPDDDAVEALTDAVEATGVYAFTFDTLSGASTVHGRMFAPGVGIPEDPVTGTASGAVGAYLRYVDAFEEMPEEMQFEQGYYVDRPGRVLVDVGSEVRVGGTAVTTLDGEIRVPPHDDDEIIEA